MRSQTPGASPRERRNPEPVPHGLITLGRISARAEEPPPEITRPLAEPAHLRASGGTGEVVLADEPWRGASPRERRNRSVATSRMHSTRRISARAEEPLSTWIGADAQRAHLRASGGTRARYSDSTGETGASPRERRNPDITARPTEHRGRISARAEEPRRHWRVTSRFSAHLRASGGTAQMRSMTSSVSGASPRERRNPQTRRTRSSSRGRISARAEEPAW